MAGSSPISNGRIDGGRRGDCERPDCHAADRVSAKCALAVEHDGKTYRVVIAHPNQSAETAGFLPFIIRNHYRFLNEFGA